VSEQLGYLATWVRPVTAETVETPLDSLDDVLRLHLENYRAKAPRVRIPPSPRDMTRTRGTILAALTLAPLLALTPGHAAPPVLAERGAPQLGDHRPALEVETPAGDLVNDARVAGRPLVVDFFATWCAPCRSALADLNAARQEAKADVQFVLIDLGEPRDVVQKWAAGAPLPPGALVALDPDGVAARRWGANRLPTTFLIDATGVVRHINRGWGSGYRERLTRWLGNITRPARGAP